MCEDYKSYKEDYNLLLAVYKRMCAEHLDTTDVKALIAHNHKYCDKIVLMVRKNFPATASEISDWSDEEVRGWLRFLLEYTVFWSEKQETLIGLLWSLDIKGRLQPVKEVVQLCTHPQMAEFVKDACKSSAVMVLRTLIDKYACFSQAEGLKKTC